MAPLTQCAVVAASMALFGIGARGQGPAAMVSNPNGYTAGSGMPNNAGWSARGSRGTLSWRCANDRATHGVAGLGSCYNSQGQYSAYQRVASDGGSFYCMG